MAPFCVPCGRFLSDKQAMEQHLRSSGAPHPFCDLPGCDGRRFSSENALEDHILNKHPPTFDCVTCSRSFLTPDRLQSHYRGSPSHPNCAKCGLGFFDAAARYEHHLSEHPRVPCQLCGGVLVYEDEIDQHFLNAARHPKCEACGMGFATQEDFDDHQVSTHFPFECTVCDRKFPTEETLHRHYVVSDAHPKCSVCKSAFKNEHDLEEHTITHPTPREAQLISVSKAQPPLPTPPVHELHGGSGSSRIMTPLPLGHGNLGTPPWRRVQDTHAVPLSPPSEEASKMWSNYDNYIASRRQTAPSASHRREGDNIQLEDNRRLDDRRVSHQEILWDFRPPTDQDHTFTKITNEDQLVNVATTVGLDLYPHPPATELPKKESQNPFSQDRHDSATLSYESSGSSQRNALLPPTHRGLQSTSTSLVYQPRFPLQPFITPLLAPTNDHCWQDIMSGPYPSLLRRNYSDGGSSTQAVATPITPVNMEAPEMLSPRRPRIALNSYLTRLTISPVRPIERPGPSSRTSSDSRSPQVFSPPGLDLLPHISPAVSTPDGARISGPLSSAQVDSALKTPLPPESPSVSSLASIIGSSGRGVSSSGSMNILSLPLPDSPVTPLSEAVSPVANFDEVRTFSALLPLRTLTEEVDESDDDGSSVSISGAAGALEESLLDTENPTVTAGEPAQKETPAKGEDDGNVAIDVTLRSAAVNDSVQAVLRVHCRICMADWCKEPAATNCGHLFCYKCISEHILQDSRCPVCSRAIMLNCLLFLDLS